MRDIFFVAFLFYAVAYAFKRPYLGVAAWIWIALIAPSEWAFGFSQSFRLNLSIALATILAYLVADRDKGFYFDGISAWVLFFGVWTLVSTIFNQNTFPELVWSYWNQFAKVLMLYFSIALIVKKRLHLDVLIWAMVFAVSAYAGMEAVKFILSGGGHKIEGRAGIIRDRNDLAVAINMCLPLLIYLMQTTKSRFLRLGLIGLLLLNILAIVGTYSRGGFIGLAILGFAFWLKSKRKFAWAFLAIILIPSLYQLAPADWRERQGTIATAAEEDSSFIGRLWAWKVSTMIALDRPFTGGGFGAVQEWTLWSEYASQTPNFPPVATPPIPPNQSPKAAHNIYFQVLGDHGFVGLFIFLMLLLLAWQSNRKSVRVARSYDVHWYQHLAGALTLSLIGYGVTGANVSLAYFDLFYAILGLISVMGIHRAKLLSIADPRATAGVENSAGQRLPAGRGVQVGVNRYRLDSYVDK